ncbi:MAG: class I SAM-dependent methyltransferase, partial [Lachnospiraceae bacterium]
MKISKRLTAVTEMVTAGSYAFDVGCDHGYTSITLVEKGICPGAVASDVREGPLQAASANVSRAHLSDRICLVLADGIPKNPESYLPANAPASLIVTGMGGQLILRILQEAGSDLRRFSELILGPQSEIPIVRKAIGEMSAGSDNASEKPLVRNDFPDFGFEITDERIVEEDGKYYFLIKASRKQKTSAIQSEAKDLIEVPAEKEILRHCVPQNDSLEPPAIQSEAKDLIKEPAEELCLAFGRPLLLRKDPILARFLNWRYGILKNI